MATFDYHTTKNVQIVVQQLNELFGDKLNLDIIKTVAESCHFDVDKSSNELIEIANYKPAKSQFVKMSYTPPVQSPNKKSRKTIEIERVIGQINNGYKVLILLRGLPGSGKTTLAKLILQNTIGCDQETSKNHILSADDFFMKNGVYQYNVTLINEAHGFNHQRAFKVMSKGYSPVVIDNTNCQMWEMKPYAQMAADYGYILDILEPDTHWCFNEKELEKRNKHGVTKSKIRQMLEGYEKNVTPMKLLTAYDCKYKLQKPPQYRLHPPLSLKFPASVNGVLKSPTDSNLRIDAQEFVFNKSSEGKSEANNFMEFPEPNIFTSNLSKHLDLQSSSVDDILLNGNPPFLQTPVLEPTHANKNKSSTSLFDNITAWGVDETALRSWDIVTPLEINESKNLTSSTIVIDDDDDPETCEVSTNTDDDDFYVLRNVLSIQPNNMKSIKILHTCNRDINRNVPRRPQGISKKLMLDKSCMAEDLPDDINLDQLERVFPNVNKRIIKFWYEKCNRDFDCTIELLLEEKEEIINILGEVEEEQYFEGKEEDVLVDSDSSASSASEATAASPNKKQKRKNNNSSSSDESHNLKKYIESKVAISENHYSEKLLKIRRSKYGPSSSNTINQPTNSNSSEESPINNAPEEMETDDENVDEDERAEPSPQVENDDNFETLQLNLGDQFVKQLEDHFGDPNLLYPKGFQPVVQVPVALARQLYTFYIESVYQQMDAQQSIMDELIKEDEEFARKLQESEEATSKIKLAEKKPSESTEIPDIMKEQRELGRWQKEADKWKEDTPDTLAARLTRQKLFKSFPMVHKDTLIEILHAHDNVYKDTVETLLINTGTDHVNGDMNSFKEPPINSTVVQEMWEEHENCKDEGKEEPCSASTYREEASRYLEKRMRLYEKAQKYYQSGLKEVAQFYSALASKQTRLYEHANSLAATAFLDEHSKRLEDFNTLDLHFLYIKEAIPHMDIFLDRNINLLRLSSSKNTEHLHIITGRGKNSKNGVAKIRPAVIARLRERDIRYHQLNPGLLKLKITKNSLLTSEL